MLFFFCVFGLIFWKYLDSKLTAERNETEKVAEPLAAPRLHTAEHYVSKRGPRQTTDQIMDAMRIG
ncbi:hypothetical protein RGR602_CH01864 [Rhizobium gallicum bv. gallicum R602sp]|uniref:Uncharacterized protein n=1 Tax=Rhizobium gallicum bv. gallicum R602sp TaxID=1041138 RepID=A0A0B4X386_9HYPH|nr:hypothetical protein RGR602_CH01864 [Rhizobium gallicum bv. gallicum R602sp]